MKNKKISIYYDERMALMDETVPNISKSPLKPRRMVEFIAKNEMNQYFNFKTFIPFEKEEFYLAHFKEYVDGFFNGVKPICESNGLTWSAQFADSVRYTNASLYSSILNSIKNPEEVSFSNTSGFHHATPDEGMGFCTFSGQVIASIKIYRDLGLSGAYIDLDGHYGNSIEDSRYFVPNLNEAIPQECNINPWSDGKDYIIDLKDKLEVLKNRIFEGSTHYVVFCHGADSHVWDDFGHQLNTEQWLECSKIVYNFIKEIETKLNKPFPLTLSLFGGYRRDDYNSVLSLHLADLVECLNTLCGNNITYIPTIKEK